MYPEYRTEGFQLSST